MLQRDNASSHSSFLVRDFLIKHATTVLPQPLYSPDLAPADFFPFPKLKSTLKGRHFESIEANKTNSLAHLRSIPKTDFQECFRTLKKCWQRCIQSRGEYFEGDKAEKLQGETGKFLRDIFGNFPDRPRILGSPRCGNRSYCVESVIWKKLWTCHKTENLMNERTDE